MCHLHQSVNIDNCYIFDDINMVVSEFLSQYPLSKIQNNPRYQHKVTTQFVIKHSREEVYEGTIKAISCQNGNEEWGKIIITLYYRLWSYPELHTASCYSHEDGTEELHPNFLAECQLDAVKKMAVEIGANKIKCYYHQKKMTVAFIFYHQHHEVLVIRLRPGCLINDHEDNYYYLQQL